MQRIGIEIFYSSICSMCETLRGSKFLRLESQRSLFLAFFGPVITPLPIALLATLRGGGGGGGVFLLGASSPPWGGGGGGGPALRLLNCRRTSAGSTLKFISCN